MNWKDDISDLSRGWMELLGNFGPTVNEQKRELKGYLHDDEGGDKAYLDSGELREIAASCIEVANWLDDRADKTANDLAKPPGAALCDRSA